MATTTEQFRQAVDEYWNGCAYPEVGTPQNIVQAVIEWLDRIDIILAGTADDMEIQDDLRSVIKYIDRLEAERGNA